MIDIQKISKLYAAHINKMEKSKSHSKQDITTALVLLRYLIRCVAYYHNENYDELRYFRRQQKLLEKQQQISFVLLDIAIKQLRSRQKTIDTILVELGRIAICLFDMWQISGATRDELFNLCGTHICALPEWKVRRLADEDPNQRFSELVTAYNLDYPENGDEFLMDEVDAPFTHAIKEHIVFMMTNTEAGREASHAALCDVFPELMEKAYHLRKNEFGEQCLYDSEGNFVGVVEKGGYEK